MYPKFSTYLFPLIFYYYSTNNGTPRFNLQIWNVRDQTINNSHKTNNFSEKWNNLFNKLVRSSNSSVWTVL